MQILTKIKRRFFSFTRLFTIDPCRKKIELTFFLLFGGENLTVVIRVSPCLGRWKTIQHLDCAHNQFVSFSIRNVFENVDSWNLQIGTCFRLFEDKTSCGCCILVENLCWYSVQMERVVYIDKIASVFLKCFHFHFSWRTLRNV